MNQTSYIMGDKTGDLERVSISLPKDLNDEFEAYRASLGISRSDAIRKAMRQFLEFEKGIVNQSHSDKQILGIISYLEEAHVHGHLVADPNKPHQHGHQTHIHGDHKSQVKDEQIYLKKYTPPTNQIEYIKINQLQHEYLDCIISTTHIHADINQCMLIISVRGKFDRIKELYRALSSFKTIRELNLSVFHTDID